MLRRRRLDGAERDLARVRGAAGGDRTALIGSLTAILERQPAAVTWAHRQLERLRDHAAATLAYEFAARIQDEIDALDWVSCARRVTTMDAANLTIAGWSGGMLIQFLIRGGRVCAWSQQPDSLPGVAPALAGTPAALARFRSAQRCTRRQPGWLSRLGECLRAADPLPRGIA